MKAFDTSKQFPILTKSQTTQKQKQQSKLQRQSKRKKNSIMIQDIYLVLSATGRQGSAVVDALLAKNANVFGSSRNPQSLKKQRGTYSSIACSILV